MPPRQPRATGWIGAKFISSEEERAFPPTRPRARSRRMKIFEVRHLLCAEETMTTANDVGKLRAVETSANIQWLALVSGFLGWLFDSMDLNLFTLVLFPSLAELLHTTNAAEIAKYGGYLVAIKLFCLGIGGILFGVGGG